MSQQLRLSNFFCGASSSHPSDLSSDSNTPSSSTSSTSATGSRSSIAQSSSPLHLPECPVNPLNPADLIGHLHSLSRDYKQHLIELGPYQPRLTSYPAHHSDGQKRLFQAKWFDLPCSNEWLEYLFSKNKMFCFVCRMFGIQCGEKKEDNWISVGVTGGNWKNSVKRIREHAVTQYHMSSMVAFKNCLQGKPIDTLLDEQRAELHSKRQKEIASNREVLAHLLDIIRLLAKQNLAFRGHDESASSVNRGNFLELVHHQAKYDPILQQHLQKAGENATYLSPDFKIN